LPLLLNTDDKFAVAVAATDNGDGLRISIIQVSIVTKQLIFDPYAIEQTLNITMTNN